MPPKKWNSDPDMKVAAPNENIHRNVCIQIMSRIWY